VLVVLTRRLDFALLALFAPTAHHPWQESQVDFIFIVQVKFACQSTPLQLLQARRLLLVFWIRTADGEDWTLHTIALTMQAATHTAFADLQFGLLSQSHGQQFCGPRREGIAQVSWVAFLQFQQFLEELLGDPGRASDPFLRQYPFQTGSIEFMSVGCARSEMAQLLFFRHTWSMLYLRERCILPGFVINLMMRSQ